MQLDRFWLPEGDMGLFLGCTLPTVAIAHSSYVELRSSDVRGDRQLPDFSMSGLNYVFLTQPD